MIASRLIPKQTVTKKLHKMGCERVDEIDGHSYWKTKKGFHFFVPELGPLKMTPETVFYEILADISKSDIKHH